MTYETGLSMEERVTSLFQPDTLLPEQFLDTFRRRIPLEPEKKLMLAILEDAIACYQKYLFAKDGKGKALFSEAEEWITDPNEDWVFSFAAVCETLGLDPAFIRRGMLDWRDKAVVTSRTPAKIADFSRDDAVKRKNPKHRTPSRRVNSLRTQR